MIGELALLRVVVVDLVEEILVEVRPFLKGEFLAEDARGDVAGDEGSLDEDSTGATHRVNEVAVAFPSRHQDHAGSQHFIKRRLYAFLAVASAVKALAAGVESDGGIVVGNVYVETDIRIGHRDVGTLAGLLAELVHDGILDLIGDEA